MKVFEDAVMDWRNRLDTPMESIPSSTNDLNTFDEVTLPSRHKFLSARKSGALDDLPTMCGIDNAPNAVTEDGHTMEWYPWLGVLTYPHDNQRLVTAVVLVTSSMVIASALEIDKLPKEHFRDLARVILGRNCSGASIGVADYTFHHEFNNDTYSTLALIQLELGFVEQDIHPICPPPTTFTETKFHAMILSDDCTNSTIRMYEISYVSPEECHRYYRDNQLDISSIWPKHVACGQTTRGGRCLWRNGATLVVKQDGRWHLLGFGVYGPGCEAPSRFIDYSQYAHWVNVNIARKGRPAITRMADNQIIMRRSRNKIQRFGPCDRGEMKTEIYTDTVHIEPPEGHQFPGGHIRYNVTIHANVDYHCIILKAWNNPSRQLTKNPIITLNRYCLSPTPICYSPSLLQIDFFVEIYYFFEMKFRVVFYGQEWAQLDAKGLIKFYNHKDKGPAIPYDAEERQVIIPSPY